MTTNACRFCAAPLRHILVDLGMSPLCESYVSVEAANEMEPFFPLCVYVCEECFLAQLGEFVRPENIFSEYAYFSSYSASWLDHARRYTDMIIGRLGLNTSSSVMELASNDGYLLQNFVARGIPALGVEPAANVAKVAAEKGIRTVVAFFGPETARELVRSSGPVDLLIANNVLAHVPDLNGFVSGMKTVLKPNGTITVEFPHLMQLMQLNQFDTIYHEHFSYFSFTTAERVFAQHGLTVYDVEELATHGGSLRLYAQHADFKDRPVGQRVGELRERERDAGCSTIGYYRAFDEQVKETKRKLLEFLIQAKRAGKSVAGYGAPGKGNTLLNYCGIRTDFIDYTVDRNPYKQGKLLPGTRIPIYHPDHIAETRPDYVLILPWNVADEIMNQMSGIREWNGKFVIPIPEVSVVS